MLAALGDGLLLPAVAVLHVRHARVRESGAILGTAAGVTAVAVGIAASASAQLSAASLLLVGIWWWTIGKLWVETDALPRTLGLATMALAALAVAAALASAPLALDAATLRTAARLLLGLWTLGLAAALWRERRRT